MTENENENLVTPEETIKELCLCNGLSYEKVDQEGNAVSRLEMFFSGYSVMLGLSYFPNLTTLTIVGQNIQKIENLKHCPLLRELWICECYLTKIEELQHCKNLKNLYLYCNKINKIENLQRLEELEVLWLNNNQIKVIEGLETLKKLKELNLADNFINKVGDCLDPNAKLERLNLSGNRIYSLKELTNLTRLPLLMDLSLKDSQYNTNPVCVLYNYATHVLYHLPQLQKLDTYDVSNKEIRERAESTVMKKIMYYNMRMKIIHRQLKEKLQDLSNEEKHLQAIPKYQIKHLIYAVKSMERELSELQKSTTMPTNYVNREETDPQMKVSGSSGRISSDSSELSGLEQKILYKLAALKERLEFWRQKHKEIEDAYQEEIKRMTEYNELMVQFLLLELETVGNVRFEEGTPTDIWFTSCSDLMLSRFCVWDFKVYNITGIKINRIIRVHNRILRLQFEEKFHMFLEEEECGISQNHRKMMEYLFYVPAAGLSGGSDHLLHILECGFEGEQHQLREEVVVLSNSLSLCEQPRIDYLLQENITQDKASMDEVPFRHGRIVIAKVFLGRSMQAKEDKPINKINYEKANSVFRPRRTDRNMSSLQNIESTCSSIQHENCGCSLRQCEWFVFEHELVLPEYVIDFEYITQDEPRFAFVATTDDGRETTKKAAFCLDVCLDEEILNMEPTFKARPKIISLDEKTILSVAKANIYSQITVLNLHGNSLNKLKELSRLTCLQKLIVSFNELCSLDDISNLPNLEYLDASHNHLTTLNGFKGMTRMKYLDLSFNELTQTKEEIGVLCKHASNLLSLDIQFNPWQKIDSLHLYVISCLKSLSYLNGVPVTEEDTSLALHLTAGTKLNQVTLLINSRTDEVRPRCLSLLSSAEILHHFSKNNFDTQFDMNSDRYSKITSLNLDAQCLSRLTNLGKLVNVRWASFNSNNLTKIEGLENWIHLEELSLDGNCISKLDGLPRPNKLVRLSLNNNQLSSLDGVLCNMPYLHYLSVENNRISSLLGLQKVHSLIELYIGNNCISTSRDIYLLKGLCNLVILDMYGNPLTKKQENYRLFVLYHMPALKALDGITIEQIETENAKDLFGGRLTPDMVAEKLGHSNFGEMTQLDWPASSLRTVDLSPPEQFTNLWSVNLEHNNLTSFGSLIFLPNVKVLSLNHNHIVSILSRQKTQNHISSRQLLYQKVISSGYGQQGGLKGNKDAGYNENLTPIMESLEVLHLGYNGISNLAQLQLRRLKNLKALFLQGNEITQLEGLEGLHHLRELVLDHNRIKVINENSFTGQKCLLELHLEENRIRELSNLNPLLKLQRLFLGFNKIQDMSELRKLDVLLNLIELSLIGNNVTRKSLHRPLLVLQLPNLQKLDGIPVNAEERARAEFHLLEQQAFSTTNQPVEGGFPGTVSILAKPFPVRVTNVSLTGGLQNFLGSDILFSNTCEDLANETSKCKKSKNATVTLTNNPRSMHAEIAIRQVKGGTNYSSTYLAPRIGSSPLVNANPSHQNQESR
ncbi:leucine-rich repeat-containing protein 9 [Protopterus annectens]|uniref:leucine-rich repeat-containing protein 9 n=1 Tax=Protopterus annectens TaxID=7888 RepID=UPI001CFAF54B|nr:leucine-rich repeat-containing protein 9 [Protopterus annectens]